MQSWIRVRPLSSRAPLSTLDSEERYQIPRGSHRVGSSFQPGVLVVLAIIGNSTLRLAHDEQAVMNIKNDIYMSNCSE
jgi:hypothetical protein